MSFTAATAAVCNLLPVFCSLSPFPVVDLGYERHVASGFHPEGNYYNFSNIRYAQPPVGELRFMAPQKPTGRNPKVEDGSIGRICPQSAGAWQEIAGKFIPKYLFGADFNYTMAADALPNRPPPGRDPRETEDCLFLDVNVPKPVWESGKDDAPVLVWIYGGGYTGGEKTGDGTYDPTGLFNQTTEEFIQVAMNYRLGAFGWLGGQAFTGQGGTANAALYDQRLALEWVQDNIHLFGGDKTRVTVMGESAGGGSIMHQITAYGGKKGPAPFAQAIPMSAAFQPNPYPALQDATFDKFLKQLGVETLEDAQKLPSNKLIMANDITSYNAPYGSGGYGPVVDGVFVPDLPQQLLADGRFYKDLNVMTTYVAMEGLIFTSPAIQTDKKFTRNIENKIPGIPSEAVEYIKNTLYPADDYKGQFERAVAITEDLAFTCNENYINKAFGNQTYTYQFAVFPALHGADVPYTWWHGASGQVASVRKAMQGYLTSFITDGKPVAKGQPDIPKYGDDARIVKLLGGPANIVHDGTDNPRCAWWQEVPFL